MAAQTKLSQPLVDAGTVECLHANLQGDRYTLAIHQYVYDAGVMTLDEIARFAERYDHTVYGIQPGKEPVKKIIASNAFGLGDFKLEESSEESMPPQLSC